MTETMRDVLRGPASQVGKPLPRRAIRAHLHGRGRYVDDIRLPGLLHAAFLRSPYAHARIGAIRLDAARQAPGVVAAFTGADVAAVCQPWTGVLTHFTGMRSAPQHPLALERATWQGEAVAMVLARSRAQAEDALALVEVDWEELPALTSPAQALAAEALHPQLPDNMCFQRRLETPGFEAAWSGADHVIERRFRFGRQTGVTLEPRGILASFEPGARELTVHHSHQAPHMVRDILARLFGLPDADVRVLNPDVGGAFGLKVHLYPDEVACVSASVLTGQPVKFVADRLEAFQSDIHAREHEVVARIALRADGEIVGFDVEDVAGIGPYSMYPRTSAMEGLQLTNFVGGPYRHGAYRAVLQVVFQNKAPTSQYRAVGHPLACAVTEVLVDAAARELRLDPAQLRARNYIGAEAYPYTSPSGMRFERLSHGQCLRRLLDAMDYEGLRQEQQRARTEGRWLGIGLAAMIELSNPGAAVYAAGGAPISSQDGATVRLEPSGLVTCSVSVGEQGQGSEAVFAQVAATALGLAVDQVRLLTGDTRATPFGGGAWGSRGAGIGGETVFQAAWALRGQLLALAAAWKQAPIERLSLQGGQVRLDGQPLCTLRELAHVGYLDPGQLPTGFQPELVATRHYAPREYPLAFTNGIQGCLVQVDTDTGQVRVLRHWVVEDCGTVLNPLLADEQVRGGVVQGLGSALYEECLYDEQGQLQNGTLADYLVPMAGEMPDIEVHHVCTPTRTSVLGAKGVGEAGTCGAPAAVLNAVNDALAPLGARPITCTPVTPAVVLRALRKLNPEEHP
jgi:aerobic carbon-monoxide dehydrogenase large subunit